MEGRGTEPSSRGMNGLGIEVSLSVVENLMIGAHTSRPGSWDLNSVLGAFPLLDKLKDRGSNGLSGGERQILAIGRALMSNPRLLLMDEVSLGLAPIVVRQVYEAIPIIKAQGTTILIVEQDVNQALSVADRFYCLLEGRISLTGTPVSADRQQITDAYFGLTSNGPASNGQASNGQASNGPASSGQASSGGAH